MAQKMPFFCLSLGFLLLVSQRVLFSGATPSSPVCSTPACNAAASYLSASMNTSVSPCENFDAYACGGWKSSHTIPTTQFETGTFYIAIDSVASELIQTLGDFPLGSSASKNTSSSVQYAAYIYQKCAALGKAPATVGHAHLKEVVKGILGDEGWSIGRDVEHSPGQVLWKESFVRAFLASVSTVVDISLLPNLHNVTEKSVFLQPTTFPLLDIFLQNVTANSKAISVYKEVISQSAALFCDGKCNQTLLSQDIDDIIRLESQLALHKLSPTEARDISKAYQMVSLKTLEERSNFTFFATLLVPILKHLGLPASTISRERPLLVTSINYTVYAFSLFANTPPRTLLNYLGWRAVDRYGPYSSESLRQVHFALNRETLGIAQMKPRAELCNYLANYIAPYAVSRLYVDAHFTKKAKEEARQMIDTIQDSLRTLLQGNDWLDGATKNASLRKLSHVRKNVAYPEWLLSNGQLDAFHNLQNASQTRALLNQDNYLASLASFSEINWKSTFASFNEPIDLDKSWTLPPAMVNAAYHPFQNSITIPAAFLRSPFFDSERPFSMNYGSIGYLVGHEFTHGLDDMGRHFDESGNLRDWWSPEAARRFTSKSHCYVAQYGDIIEPVTRMHLNALNNLGENIADNGGLRGAFHAFQARQAISPASPTLARLPKFTSEQLFFLSFANTWCTLVNKAGLNQQILYDPHAPNKYRINVPLRNSPDFARAFNCPAGSPMNPVKKCQVW